MNLEEIYSEELHKQVTENQLELVWKSAEDTAYEKQAMDKRCTKIEVAQKVIEMYEV